MNENYSELEKELQKLRSELEIQDELTNRFISPVSTNYWQKRLEEEKILWEKRIQSKEEEKKILESKLSQQDINLKNYEEKLKDLEKSFERELKDWQEKFRIKEADLLLEKNRILWEEKIKDAESESRQLLEKISSLNENINRTKDEYLQEKAQLATLHADELRVFSEKTTVLEKINEQLNTHIEDIKNSSAARLNELNGELAEHIKKNSELSDISSRLSEQKNDLLKEIDELKIRAVELQDEIRSKNSELIDTSLATANRVMGLLNKISRYRKKYELLPAQEVMDASMAIADIFEKLSENQPPSIKPITRKVVCVGYLPPESDTVVENIQNINVYRLSLKEAKKIKDIKPVVVLCSDIKAAHKIASAYPFLPVIHLGALKERVKNLSSNITLLTDLAIPTKTVKILEELLSKSIALESIWSSLIPRKKPSNANKALISAAAVVIFAVLLSPYFKPSYRIRQFSVPYSLPSSITVGSSFIWTCDWQSGAIYQHNTDDTLSLNRIVTFPNNNFSVISEHGGALFTFNPWSKKINKHTLNESFTIEKSYAAGEVNISGMAFAKEKLFVSDMTKSLIHTGFLNEKTGAFEITNSVVSPGASPVGLWHDGLNLWSSDSATNRVYRHRADLELSVAQAYVLPKAFQKNFKLSGFAGRKGIIWVSSERLGKIFSIPISKLIPVKPSRQEG